MEPNKTDSDADDEYAAEAKKRWGGTITYQQSQERAGKMSKEDIARIRAESDALLKEIAAAMPKGPKSPEVQALIARHYESLKHFYEPNLEMYRGLGKMYADDPLFSTTFEKYAPGMAEFMHQAIDHFCNPFKNNPA
ncbi:MAG: TipAS antibiotic-recognition domain-containing protein [Candidatus Pacebacteria bacterium]|jgi:hypothetical protein|nr:TipAS antibiotic-recognition domain-containing protein [Candidatus Paceibacterota bacterium]